MAQTPVLLVEDHPDGREALTMLLRVEGFEVIGVDDGEAALAALRIGPKPCAIILDLIMPRMNGRQFLDAIATVAEWSRIPVIVLSGTHLGIERVAAELGISPDHCLLKPTDPQELSRLVAQYCRRRIPTPTPGSAGV